MAQKNVGTDKKKGNVDLVCICVNCTNIPTIEMENIDYESCESSSESEEEIETEINTEANSFMDDLLII